MTSTDGGCDDSIESSASASPPPQAPAGPRNVYVGSGDTYFMIRVLLVHNGLPPSVSRCPQMKIGIYSLDWNPPQVTVRRLDGTGEGRVTFSPTSGSMSRPLPTRLYFPSTSCWEVTARGTTGMARIYVRVESQRRAGYCGTMCVASQPPAQFGSDGVGSGPTDFLYAVAFLVPVIALCGAEIGLRAWLSTNRLGTRS